MSEYYRRLQIHNERCLTHDLRPTCAWDISGIENGCFLHKYDGICAIYLEFDNNNNRDAYITAFNEIGFESLLISSKPRDNVVILKCTQPAYLPENSVVFPADSKWINFIYGHVTGVTKGVIYGVYFQPEDSTCILPRIQHTPITGMPWNPLEHKEVLCYPGGIIINFEFISSLKLQLNIYTRFDLDTNQIRIMKHDMNLWGVPLTVYPCLFDSITFSATKCIDKKSLLYLCGQIIQREKLSTEILPIQLRKYCAPKIPYTVDYECKYCALHYRNCCQSGWSIN